MKKSLFISVIIFIITVILALSFEMNSNDTYIQSIYENEIVIEETKAETGEESYEKGNYEEFKRINQDVLFVLHFYDRDLPVVFNGDNEFYVRKNLIKEYSSMGTPFVDQYTGFQGRNTLIHAHSSRNNERMFTFFKYFCDQEYADKHSFFTIEGKDQTWEMVIFSVIKIDLDQDDYRDWMKKDWRNEDEFMNFIAEIKRRSLIETSVEVDPKERFITMVTCDMSIENGRFLIFAKENI